MVWRGIAPPLLFGMGWIICFYFLIILCVVVLSAVLTRAM